MVENNIIIENIKAAKHKEGKNMKSRRLIYYRKKRNALCNSDKKKI